VAEIISVYADPGQDFATVRARPLAQLESTRHVMLVYNNASAQLSDLPAALPLDTALEVPLDTETSPLDAAPEAVESATVAAEEAPLVRETVE
jgi:cell shape-determining protein MreC